MFEEGRVCVKIAGRDAGKRCVIIDVIDKNMVMVDGETRRRKVNLRHLEATKTVLEIGKNASNKEVVEALKGAGIEVAGKKEAAPQEKKEKPKRKRKERKPSPAKTAKPAKKKVSKQSI